MKSGLIVLGAVLALGCSAGKETSVVESSQQALTAKTTICHLTGNGVWKQQEIAQPAVDAHLAKGDVIVDCAGVCGGTTVVDCAGVCGGTDVIDGSGNCAMTFKSISAGYFNMCGVKPDGTVVCWGDNTYGQSMPPAGVFASTSGGYRHMCGVKPDGTVVCWGDNTYGQSTPPAGVFASISAGYLNTCGVKPDGTVVCWGDNTYGQSTPPAGVFAMVSTARYYTLGLGPDGSIVCWGESWGSSNCMAPPTGAVDGVVFSTIGAGPGNAYALRIDGTAFYWSSNWSGVPLGMSSSAFTSLSVGENGPCVVRVDGTIVCSGWLQTIRPDGTFTSVAVGSSHVCGIRTDETVACWGGALTVRLGPPSP